MKKYFILAGVILLAVLVSVAVFFNKEDDNNVQGETIGNSTETEIDYSVLDNKVVEDLNYFSMRDLCDDLNLLNSGLTFEYYEDNDVIFYTDVNGMEARISYDYVDNVIYISLDSSYGTTIVVGVGSTMSDVCSKIIEFIESKMVIA